jgi:hypothetical protein
VDAVERWKQSDMYPMGRIKTTYKKMIHSLPCGCQCFEVQGKKRAIWERCYRAEILAKQFGKNEITLQEYSNHFKLNYE